MATGPGFAESQGTSRVPKHNNSAVQDDPFFSWSPHSEWNACIGLQADEEQYVDGYMEAALELAAAVIDKNLYAKRDILAMPILYNARHAVELALKFVISRLNGMGVMRKSHAINHDIEAHWRQLDEASIGDVGLRTLLQRIKPFVHSLSAIDDDGEQLRYHQTRDGAVSLADKTICDLERIRRSLVDLGKNLYALKRRATEFCDERATGTYTNKCSRRDLLEIARMLPPKTRWSDPDFKEHKTAIKKRFGLSGKALSQSLNIIKQHRELGSFIGIEFPLEFLTDEHALYVISEWKKAHPRQNSDKMEFTNIAASAFEEYFAVKAAVCKAVLQSLSSDEIADLYSIFTIGRERCFCEYYDETLSETRKRCQKEDELPEMVNYLITKSCLPEDLAQGLEVLGRLKLAAEIRTFQDT